MAGNSSRGRTVSQNPYQRIKELEHEKVQMRLEIERLQAKVKALETQKIATKLAQKFPEESKSQEPEEEKKSSFNFWPKG